MKMSKSFLTFVRMTLLIFIRMTNFLIFVRRTLLIFIRMTNLLIFIRMTLLIFIRMTMTNSANKQTVTLQTPVVILAKASVILAKASVNPGESLCHPGEGQEQKNPRQFPARVSFNPDSHREGTDLTPTCYGSTSR